MKLFVKYCGGCNPIINRKKLVYEVIDQLKLLISFELTVEEADVGLIVCGCPVCCLNLDDFINRASELVIVGGQQVNYIQVPTDQQVTVIVQRVLETVKNPKEHRCNGCRI